MGYQESLVMVRSLAEAAGIRRAFKELENHSWIDYLVTDVPKRDMLMGSEWGFETDPEHCWTLPAGTPCVVIARQRHPHQLCTGRWEFIDALQGIEKGHYYDFFDALDEDAIEKAWASDPLIAEKAYEAWKLYIQSDSLDDRYQVRDAVEHGIYGIEGDDEWLKSCREQRITPWQRDLEAGTVEPYYDDLPF